MIYTVTLNPSLDYIVSVDEFAVGRTNRTASERLLPGGKGINVSIVLKNLGFESTALGFLAGFTGDEIARRLDDYGIKGEFIRLDSGNSRINMKIKNMEGTEINGMGPDIPQNALGKLRLQTAALTAGDVLILSGSIPQSIPDTIYKELLMPLSARRVLCVVDTAGPALLHALPCRPFLIKPNRDELGELFHTNVDSVDEAVSCAKRLRELGAVNVLVSMGGMGAVLVEEGGVCYKAPAPSGKAVNTVGAGDSMIAGFLSGWLTSEDYDHAFRMGLAAGSASAFSEGLATAAEIEAVYGRTVFDKFYLSI